MVSIEFCVIMRWKWRILGKIREEGKNGGKTCVRVRCKKIEFWSSKRGREEFVGLKLTLYKKAEMRWERKYPILL